MIDWPNPHPQYMPRRVRPALKWHGGKYYLARRIIQQLPIGSFFCEPFVGGANVSLNLRPDEWSRRVIADRNPKLITLYKVIRDSLSEVESRLVATEYSEQVFNVARERDEARTLTEPAEGAVPDRRVGDVISRAIASNRSG